MSNKLNRFKIEIVENEDSVDNASATSMSISSAIAMMVQSAFEEGFKVGKAKEKDEDYTPNIGPFFDRDTVSVKCASIDKSDDFYSSRDFENLEEKFDLLDREHYED